MIRFASVFLFAALSSSAFAQQDAARPEAMVSFFLEQTHQTKQARQPFATAGQGRIVKTSWYGGGESLNRHTASGAVFRPGSLSAAHRTLPLWTRVRLSHGARSVVAVINDRGPAKWTGRELDVSRGTARALGFLSQGVAHVRMEVMR